MNQITDQESNSPDQLGLILMRHAKSDWSDSSCSDHDRVLNKRGRRDAPRMAAWLASIHRVPDLVLCSSAARTKETVELMQQQWTQSPTVIHSGELYLATEDEIFAEIQRYGMDARLLMVLAHNPGISYAASALADQSVEMPTAAVALFDLGIASWAAIHSDCERTFSHSMRPKALPES